MTDKKDDNASRVGIGKIGKFKGDIAGRDIHKRNVRIGIGTGALAALLGLGGTTAYQAGIGPFSSATADKDALARIAGTWESEDRYDESLRVGIEEGGTVYVRFQDSSSVEECRGTANLSGEHRYSINLTCPNGEPKSWSTTVTVEGDTLVWADPDGPGRVRLHIVR
jgi:hypothetical protein